MPPEFMSIRTKCLHINYPLVLGVMPCPNSDARAVHFRKNPQKALAAFQTFYSSLSKAPSEDGQGKVSTFLAHFPVPTLSSEHCDILEALVSEGEILKAIALKHVVVQRLVLMGFRGLYYHKFKDLLVPHLEQFFDALRKGRAYGARL